jgi:hypothetical protein
VPEPSGFVAYEVYGYDSLSESGWSVAVKGTGQLVHESVETDRHEQLGLRSLADIKGLGFWVRIRPVETTEREILPPRIDLAPQGDISGANSLSRAPDGRHHAEPWRLASNQRSWL